MAKKAMSQDNLAKRETEAWTEVMRRLAVYSEALKARTGYDSLKKTEGKLEEAIQKYLPLQQERINR